MSASESPDSASANAGEDGTVGEQAAEPSTSSPAPEEVRSPAPANVDFSTPTRAPTEDDKAREVEEVREDVARAEGDSADAAAEPVTESDDEPSADDEPSEEGEASEEPAAPAKPGRAETAGKLMPTARQTADRSWYVLKVQSNREDSIREAIMRRLRIAGLEEYVNEIVVPTDRVTEMKGNKKRVVERKFYPGYIVANLELTEDVWYVIRETPGVGDFIGSGGKPLPMTEVDIARMLGLKEEEKKTEKEPRLKIAFKAGDRVKIKEGPFENFEGNVDEVNEAKGRVRVVIQIFGRPNPVELGYWEIEQA